MMSVLYIISLPYYHIFVNYTTTATTTTTVFVLCAYCECIDALGMHNNVLYDLFYINNWHK